MSRRALSSSRKSESVRGMTKGRRRPKAIAKTVFASFPDGARFLINPHASSSQ